MKGHEVPAAISFCQTAGHCLDDFIDLLCCDADWAVCGDACAREQRGQEIALVALDFRQVSPGLNRTAALARDDEW